MGERRIRRGMERYGGVGQRETGERERVKERNRNGRDEGERVGYCMYTHKK